MAVLRAAVEQEEAAVFAGTICRTRQAHADAEGYYRERRRFDNVTGFLLVTRSMPSAVSVADRVLAAVDASASEIVDFTSELIRIPTINPPGDVYEDCARLIGDRLAACGFEVEYIAAEGMPEHTAAHPRVNVVGLRRGRALRPAVHLNGHFDVVPAGEGWTEDPFGGAVRDGRIYGRGACDMKAGIAAAVYAAEAIRRAGVELNGSVEMSGTVDE